MSPVDLSIPVAELHTPCPALFDLVCKLRAELVPPTPDGFITYVHTLFMKQVFNITQ